MVNWTFINNHSCGTYRIGDTRVSLDSIVYSYLNGDSPVTIQDAFPAVSLEEVNDAIGFYLANRAEVEEYLKERQALWKKTMAEIDAKPNPAWERMRRIKHERQGQT